MSEEREGYEGMAIVKAEPTGGALVQAVSIEALTAHVGIIQQVMKQVMHEGEHFGKIPGCGDKPTLLQPGAEKLAMTFRLDPEYAIAPEDLGNGHRGYEIVCTIFSIETGKRLGSGVGYCSTMETKYRFRSGSRVCPKCGQETIIKGKEEYGGGWLCFAKKGGCGAKWPDGAAEIEGQNTGRVEHDNPADFYNTAKKMAKKRAYVDAVKTVLAVSDFFTQDVEDMPEVIPPKAEQKKAAPAAKTEKTTDNHKFLNETGVLKKQLAALMGKESGETEYYRILKMYKAEHSNEIIEDKAQKMFYRELREYIETIKAELQKNEGGDWE